MGIGMGEFDAYMAAIFPTLTLLFLGGLFLLIRHIRENGDHYAEAFREYFSQRRASVEPSVQPPLEPQHIIAIRLSPNKWEVRTAEVTVCLYVVYVDGSRADWTISGTRNNDMQMLERQVFSTQANAIAAVGNIYGEQIADALGRITDPPNSPPVEPPHIVARRLGPNRWEARSAEVTAYLEIGTDIVSTGASYNWQIAGTKHTGGQLPLSEGFFVKERAIWAIQNIYGEQIATALDRISQVNHPDEPSAEPLVSNVNNYNRFVASDSQGMEVVLERMGRESNPNETRWRVTFNGDQTNTIIQESWATRERALDFIRGAKGYQIVDALDEISRPAVSDDAADATAMAGSAITSLPMDDNLEVCVVGSGGRRSISVGELIERGMLHPIISTPNCRPSVFAKAYDESIQQKVADAQDLSAELHMRMALSDEERILADSFVPDDDDFVV